MRELEWALDQDARAVVMRAAAPITAGGPLSPAADVFDPFWARVNEAGITVVVHAGDAGLSSNGYAPDGFSASFRAGPSRPSIKMFAIERAAHDFLATLMLEKLFDRFPNVRVASVENGSEFLAPLFAQAAHDHPAHAGLLLRGPGRSRSAATCGSTRSGRTTSTRSSTSWATTG